jgi:anti-anti-sigma regulatory factor
VAGAGRRGYVRTVPDPVLQCQVEPGGPLLTVRPAGVLRLDTVGRLRAAVLRGLVDEPDAVAIDLAGVTAFDDLALTELRALVQAAAAWPGVPIVVHSAAPPLRARLEALGLTRSVAVVADAAAALEAASGGPRPARVHLELTDGLGQLAQVRAMVRQACAEAGWGHAAGAAPLVATQLGPKTNRHPSL